MTINLWITKQCNLKCKYCYENGQFTRTDEDNQIKDVYDWLFDNARNIKKIIFHGGEPLLKFDYIEYIVSNLTKINTNIKFGITTNGTIWNTKISEFFENYKEFFNSDISISVDGNKETHNMNRIDSNGGTFDKVKSTCKELLKINKNIRARMTFTPNSIVYLYDNIKFLNDLGFLTISPNFDFMDLEWLNVDSDLILDQYMKVFNYWKDKENVNISLIDELYNSKPLNKCKTEINLYINGSIYPCTFVMGDETLKIGDVKNGFYTDILKNISKTSLLDNTKCIKCKNKDFCIANRCKLMNFSLERDYFEPNKVICAFEDIKNIMRKNIASVR